MKFLATINLPRLSSAPASPQTGWMYFDTTLLKARFFDGSIWVDTI